MRKSIPTLPYSHPSRIRRRAPEVSRKQRGYGEAAAAQTSAATEKVRPRRSKELRQPQSDCHGNSGYQSARFDIPFQTCRLDQETCRHSSSKHYANALYYSAANAASKKQYVKALAMLTRSVAVAISRGEVAALSRSMTQSRLLRSRLGLGVPLTDIGNANVDVAIVRDIEIPWRGKGST